MDTSTLAALIASVPNLAIAVWVIWQYQKTIDKLLVNQQKLIEQLMALHPPADITPAPPIFHIPN